MLRFVSLVTLIAAALGLWALTSSSASAPTPSGNCNLWMHEPLVAFDVTGATLAGPVDESLHVYSDGTVKRFSASMGLAKIAYISPQQAAAFSRQLYLAGALSTCDQPAAGSDVPLRTLTLFRGVVDPLAHTVNWWTDDSGPYATFQAIVDAFVAAYLP